MSDLPLGWAHAALPDVADVLDNLRRPVNTDERAARLVGVTHTYPYYGATGQAGVIDDYLFDEDLVLLGEDGVPFNEPSKAKAYTTSGKCWVNNHAHVLRARSGVMVHRLLCHALNRVDYRELVSGSTRLKLTQEAMKRIVLPVPPLGEQQRIVEKLDVVQARVTSCRDRLSRVAALLKRFRRSVLAAATSGRLTDGWRQGAGYQTTCHRFSNLVAEALVGLVRSSEDQSALSASRVPYLKMNNISENWGYSLEGVVGVRCSGDEFARYSLLPGDWLFNTRNSVELVGKSCVWQGKPVVFNNNILRIRFNERALSDFVEVWFRSPTGRVALDAIKSATTSVAAIYQRSLFAVQIDLPSIAEQAEIVRRVETLFALADRLEARLADAATAVDRLTPSLLAKAFRGELVPQDPNDEPAEAMLARICAELGGGAANKPRRRTAQTSLA
jgi:type I restriction enzyme S subunit